MSLTKAVLKYIIDRVPRGDKILLTREAQRYLTPTLRGEIITIAEQWEEEGFQKGMTIAEQWQEKGLQTGEALMLIHLVRRRFGELSPALIQKITQANSATLFLWSDRVFEATNLEDIFAEESFMRDSK